MNLEYVIIFVIGMFFNRTISYIMRTPIMNRIIKYSFLSTIIANIYYDFDFIRLINTNYVESFTIGYIYDNFGNNKKDSQKDDD